MWSLEDQLLLQLVKVRLAHGLFNLIVQVSTLSQKHKWHRCKCCGISDQCQSINSGNSNSSFWYDSENYWTKEWLRSRGMSLRKSFLFQMWRCVSCKRLDSCYLLCNILPADWDQKHYQCSRGETCNIWIDDAMLVEQHRRKGIRYSRLGRIAQKMIRWLFRRGANNPSDQDLVWAIRPVPRRST